MQNIAKEEKVYKEERQGMILSGKDQGDERE